MTNIDQFESLFRAASKPQFELEDIRIDKILIITDLDRAATDQFSERVKNYLRVFDGPLAPTYDQIEGNAFQSVRQLLAAVSDCNPDLICTYRNLHMPATEFPYSLGVYIDVLTQATKIPVLLLPRPEIMSQSANDVLADGTKDVMAVTDHLAGDHHLVNAAVKFVLPGGKLMLSHVEDAHTFARYLATIDKIPDIDSEIAKQTIMDQLLSEPTDYIESCRQVLQQADQRIEIEPIVTVGHHIVDYRRLVAEHNVDLLIMHTKDEDQLAMHGVAYPLAIELRTTPLLLL